MKSGIELIRDEREKQLIKYGYTSRHDAMYTNKELLYGALAYLSEAIHKGTGNENWPFNLEFWHPEDYVNNLKKAGAFIAAELDRLENN